MQRCRLPATFSTWANEDDLDEDAFERFREQSAQEVFASCLQLLHADFIAALDHAESISCFSSERKPSVLLS